VFIVEQCRSYTFPFAKDYRMPRSSLYEYCQTSNKQNILEQWDTEKNGDLTVHDVTKASHKLVWWKCEKGHSWQASVYSRTTADAGCPFCAYKISESEVHTLGKEFPEIVQQWHPTLNDNLTPDDVTPHSHRKVWWRCDKGHEWQAQVNSRVRGTGCPYCTNRKVSVGENDLATTHPHLASEWNFQKNGFLTPQAVVAGNHMKVWWKCSKGHEWRAAVFSRNQGAGCPVCSGKQVIAGENDLASAYPEVAAQWHNTKNGSLTPEKVTPHSNRSVWWVCEQGHEYRSAISHRTVERSGCPYCAGRKVLVGFNDLATKEPKLCEEWAQDLNGILTPEMVTVASHKRVWWRCADDHVWKAVISSRTGARRHGCPVCAGNVKRKYR